MELWLRWTLLSVIISRASFTDGLELLFEVPDKDKQCFYEDIKWNVTAILEFQVINGGNYDVDVFVEDPNAEIIYREEKVDSGINTFTTEVSGVYTICFNNDFSSFSHKMVYMDFEVGGEKPLPGLTGEMVVTNISTSIQVLHKRLSTIIDHQTHHRLREAHGRKRAEVLNGRVLWFSAMETIVVICVAVLQVTELRRPFSDKRSKV